MPCPAKAPAPAKALPSAQLGGDGRQQVSHGSCPASQPSEERPINFP